MTKMGKLRKSKKEIIIKFSGSEILERTASKFGTGTHVIIPKEHAGKKVKIIIGGEGDE
jgi:putative transposon-encoded protein